MLYFFEIYIFRLVKRAISRQPVLFSKFRVPCALMLLLVTSCRNSEVELKSTAPCIQGIDYSGHPKDSAYRALLDQYTAMGIPGLVLHVNHNGDTWEGASGIASIEQTISMSSRHLMYSASVGKMYCATAILLLMEKGKLSLEDKINMYLPGDICSKIPNGHTATIRQLLNHTSGIPDLDKDVHFGTELFNNPFGLTTDRLLSFIYDDAPLCMPGDAFHYSSTNYELLSRIIDQVTEQPHDRFYNEEIFNKHGLSNSYYKPVFESISASLPNSYFERFGNKKLENISKINYHLQNQLTGSDGVIATNSDYAAFLRKLMKGEILTPASLLEMEKFIPTDERKTDGYGLGLYVRNSPYGIYMGHGGRSVGAGIDCFYFPKTNTTVVISTNLGTYVETDLTRKYSGDLWHDLLTLVFKN